MADNTNWMQWFQNMYANNGTTQPQTTTTAAASGYKESDAVKKWRELMESQAALKPADYVSPWKPQIDSTVNSILNRKDFQYDVNSDALYQQYKDRYVNLGQQAMMDTMGQAAKLTGGYGNSNAQLVGQMAYQNYLQGLTDKIPELAQMAYDKYNMQGQDLYQKYGLLNAQDQAAYDRWNADYNRWLSERDFATGRYDTERGYDYGMYRDTVSDKQWQAQFDEDLRRYNAEQAALYGGATGMGGGPVDTSGYVGSSGGKRDYGVGYNDALVLVENSATIGSQESVIQNAYDKGYITQAGAQNLAQKIGKTEYTKK